MRVRNDPNAINYLEVNENIYIKLPNNQKGNWSKLFGNNNPIYIEVGMGKGNFIYEMAKRNKNINFIGIEKNVTILALAIKRYVNKEIGNEEKLENIRYISIDANILEEVFKNEEISYIYLNFSDPWPKSKHDKRRLTYKDFLKLYKNILKKDGIIQLKTDNKSLFEYSIISMNEYKMKFEDISVDLHNSKYSIDNVMTEYEEKFSGKGQPIYMIRCKF